MGSGERKRERKREEEREGGIDTKDRSHKPLLPNLVCEKLSLLLYSICHMDYVGGTFTMAGIPIERDQSLRVILEVAYHSLASGLLGTGCIYRIYSVHLPLSGLQEAET